jgi:hypothetical protein
MIGRKLFMGLAGAGILSVTLAACSQPVGRGTASSGMQQEEKAFALAPDHVSVRTAFLTGELQDLRVSERVDRGTSNVVDPPWLHATLKLKNVSADQTARLIGGRIEYMDSERKLISLAKERKDTTFSFATYPSDRLDPGMETSQAIEVPFPSEAVAPAKLRDIRLKLTYTPLPYKEESVTIPVSVRG